MKRTISIGLLALSLTAVLPEAPAAMTPQARAADFAADLGSAFRALREAVALAVAGAFQDAEIAPMAYGSLNGTANGHEVDLRVYSNGVSGKANGQEARLQIYSNAVQGEANGQEVRLQVYSNAVRGQANGAEVDIRIYGNGASGEANGKEFEVRAYGTVNIWQVLDALVLNLPAQVLSRNRN
ncbi:MAG: hypothetical protein HY748_09740 [Elusimicrobia bacterium]|nr:hypothetical protein [Elusimicrobiota bacterium]